MQTKICHPLRILSPTLWYHFWWFMWFRNHVACSSWESTDFTEQNIRDADLSKVECLAHKTIYSGHHLSVLLYVPQICRRTKQLGKPTRRHFSRMPAASAPPCTQSKLLQQDSDTDTAELVLVKWSDWPCKTSQPYDGSCACSYDRTAQTHCRMVSACI